MSRFGRSIGRRTARTPRVAGGARNASRYFYDTEFHWDGTSIRLISIALVSDDGRELYEHSDQYDRTAAAADPFLAEHVLPSVRSMPRRSDAELRQRITEFLEPRPTALWADFGAWDQVALMQIWGAMEDQPPWLPLNTRDVREYATLFGLRLPGYPARHHDALVDALHVRKMFRLIEHRLELAAQVDELARSQQARGEHP